MTKVKIKKLNKDAQIPLQATSGSVGFDLRVILPFDEEAGEQISKIILKPNESIKLNTGLAFQLEEGYFMQLVPRSSMGIKKNLVLQNTIGILDADYNQECLLFVKNIGDKNIEILHQERLVQAIILPYPKLEFEEVCELDNTDRVGGFGSSGRL